MAHVLNIVYGATTISLVGGPNHLNTYEPRANRAYEPRVAETVKVSVTGSTISQCQQMVRDIEYAIDSRAGRRQRTRAGDKVYVVFQPNDASYEYRSEILDGIVQLSEKTLDTDWAIKNLDITISWTRRNYWERTTEEEAALTNGNGSAILGGLAVKNHDDGTAGDDNYVQISGIGGSLPTPARLELTNTYNNATWLKTIWISQNILSNPTTFSHMLEAETGSGGTGTADAACSNGNYRALSWAATTETQILTWSLTSGLLNAASGNHMAMLARFRTTPAYSDMYVRWKFLHDSTPIWSSDLVLLTAGQAIQHLGIIPLPPYLTDQTNFYPIDLALYGYRNASGTHTLDIDFVQFSPLDHYRKLTASNNGVPYTTTVVDDGDRDEAYSTNWSSAGIIGNYAVSSNPIMIAPSETQRLYFLQAGADGSAPIDRTMTVRVYFRTRKLTI